MLYNLFENRDFVSVFAVALLAEGVDRNRYEASPICRASVALLAEGVDRNLKQKGFKVDEEVALLAEGVDRNKGHGKSVDELAMSPSSRRAWIEIS